MNRTGLIILISVISAVVIGTAIGLGVYFGTKSSDGVHDTPEYRAMWIATVDNLDWPRSPTSEESGKKEELLAYLDLMLEMNMNAVFFQIRAQGDAFYNSSIEPWSRFLTGSQGQAPEPFWDPLEFMVTEGHARGIEVHAWLNPLIAGNAGTRDDIVDTHMCKALSQYCYDHGSDLWMDPAAEEVRDRFIDVVLDVVTRYDIDGVHVDEKLFPWQHPWSEPFLDNVTFSAYQDGGGGLSLEDWRRDNINQLISRYYHEVKQLSPETIVSISPFGLYRPGDERGMPAPIVGSDPYSLLYADTRHWLDQGWMDMLVPEIYWHLASEGQPFEQILEWWLQPDVNPHGKMIVAGSALYKAFNENDWDVEELVDQVKVVRSHERYGARGSSMFSAHYFRDNEKNCVEIFKKPYAVRVNTPVIPPN